MHLDITWNHVFYEKGVFGLDERPILMEHLLGKTILIEKLREPKTEHRIFKKPPSKNHNLKNRIKIW